MKKLTILLLAAAVAMTGCTRNEPVRIGSKFFAENQILAEMMAALADEQGMRVTTSVPFGNTYALQEAVRGKELDLYPEYTGTGALLVGAAVPPDEQGTLDAVRRLYRPLGLDWLKPLGFNNSYVLVLRTDTATLWEADAISDLAERDEPLRIAADPEFLQRAVDGMASLTRRYGFSPAPETVAVENRDKLYLELMSGDVDVVVGHLTDHQIAEYQLTTLEDDLDFFPVYEAAPLVRSEVLRKRPQLADALEPLAGMLDVETMRGLNLQVDQMGLDPEEVAEAWLVEQGLLKSRPMRPYQEALGVAAPPMDDNPPSTSRVLQALRKVFPDRPVKLNNVSLPAQSLRQGFSFVAVLGGEHFFRQTNGTGPRPVGGIEAIVPVGFRVAHLMTRNPRAPEGKPFQGIKRLGVGPENGSSQRAARFLVDAYGADVELVTGDPESLAARAAAGKLDGLLVMAPEGDAGVTMLLRDNQRLSFRSIGDWGESDRHYRYPFFRLSRLSAGVYPGQDRMVETVGSQLVVAGPRGVKKGFGAGDPAAGIRIERGSLPDSVKIKLAEALEAEEAIDPVLPGENVAFARRAPEPSQPLNPDPRASWLIAGFFIALAGFFILLKRSG